MKFPRPNPPRPPLHNPQLLRTNPMITQNTVTAALGGLAVLTALPSLGNLGGAASSLTAIRQEAARVGDRANALALIEQESAAAAAVAESRYASCIPIVDQATGASYVSIIEGSPVLDRVTLHPLPTGAIICDYWGSTAILAPNEEGIPVATALAFTGDRAVVEARLDAFAGAVAVQPGL